MISCWQIHRLLNRAKRNGSINIKSLKVRNIHVHGGIELINFLTRDDLLAEIIEDGKIRNFLRLIDSGFDWLINLQLIS